MLETVLVLLDGGLIVPISHVTANYSPSNVVVYDGETYRDDPVNLLNLPYVGNSTDTTDANTGGGYSVYQGHAKALNSAATASSTPAAYASDLVTHTAPRYKGKQATLWSFSRTVEGVAAFTHVLWASNIMGTCSHAPWRVGMAPTIKIEDPSYA